MRTVPDHPAVAAYLARLDAVATHLSPARRAELRADLVEHLTDALPSDATDADVLAALDRLGTPEDVVAAEGDEPAPSVGPTTVGRRTGIRRETLAVLLLTVGSFVPYVGWLAGAVLLWTSRVWTDREKLLGTLVVPGGPFLAVAFGAGLAPWSRESCWSTEAAEGCSTTPIWTGPVATVTIVALIVAPFVVGAVLHRRAVTRR